MNTKKADVVFSIQNQLGEGPCWDPRIQTLYWLDIFGKKIYAMKDENNVSSYDTPYMVGTLGLTEDPDILILAGEHGIFLYQISENEFSFITDPESEIKGHRFNDGKIGPDGRFWAGGVRLQGCSDAEPCTFYCIDHDYSVKKILHPVDVSNGLAWSSDNKVLYYIDSPSQEIWAFDFDDKNKELTNKRVVVRIPKAEGEPDGMTIDSEGMLWVALWEGWCVKRYDPNTGEELMKIDVDAPLSSCPVFGGPDMGTLYITSAHSEAFGKPVRSENEGKLFAVRTGCYGKTGFFFQPEKR